MLNADGYLKVHNMMYENAEKGKPGYLTYKMDRILQVPTRTGRTRCCAPVLHKTTT